MNHVAVCGEGGREIAVERLDDVLVGQGASMIEIDFEGFEMAVLEGARSTLANPELMALIVELNPHASAYGYAADEVQRFLQQEGFELVSYDPFGRKQTPWTNSCQNGIFVKDRVRVEQRIAASGRFKTQAGEI
jgi:hypothetical protein